MSNIHTANYLCTRKCNQKFFKI